MTNVILIVVLVLVAVALVLQIVLLFRKAGVDLSSIQQAIESVEKSYERIERSVKEEIAKNRQEGLSASRQAREELSRTLKGMGDTLNQQIVSLTQSNDQKLERVRSTVEERLTAIQQENTTKLEQVRQDALSGAGALREEVLKGMTGLAETQQKQMAAFSEQLGKLTESSQLRLDALKTTVEEKLKAIQEDNTRQIDQMRATVDEKLQGTLEKRLGESFKQVSERLEQVHKGLGEMQALASGVGDLKKVLTNVKTRGTWGEVQLGAMLEQILTPEQYATNVATKDGGERVEFAVKLPGRSEDKDERVWLPIDAKFPVEDYQRLMEAQEKADIEAVDAAGKQLEIRIKQSARDICDKYIGPPKTTDFGILYLPIEGLFAEVIRRVGLTEYVQRECRVVIAGPTTLWSILNSLQMGFRTLAIQKRSSEVWNLLAAVKTEWSKYGAILENVQKKLTQAANTVEEASKRTRAIGRKLRDVQELPAPDAGAMLMLDEAAGGDEETEEEASP